MSEAIKTIDTVKGNLSFTKFWGGEDRGECIQLTQGLGTMISNDTPGFIQLTKEEAEKVAQILSEHFI